MKNLSNSNWIFYQGEENKYFSCFYYTIFFAVPKDVRLNSTHYFIMKIPNKRDLQQVVFNHSSDTDFGDSMNL